MSEERNLLRMRRLTTFFRGAVAVGAAVALHTTVASASDVKKDGLSAEVALGAEYQSNVRLGSGIAFGPTEAVDDDIVLRANPKLRYQSKVEEHQFTIQADGLFRKGTKTDLSEYNLGLLGAADLKFNGGFGMKAYAGYSRTGLDQALYFVNDVNAAFAGVTKSDSNNLGVEANYKPGDTFEIGGGYDYRKDRYSFDLDALKDNRKVNTIKGHFTLPVADKVAFYGKAMHQEQRAERRREFDYDERDFAGGIRWKGEKITLFAEGGHQRTDYLNLLPRIILRAESATFRGGFESQMTEKTRIWGNAGRDGFEEFVFEAGVEHTANDHDSIMLTARKSTEQAFARQRLASSSSPIFPTVIVLARGAKELAENWNGVLEFSYLSLENGDPKKDQTATGGVEIRRTVSDWIEIGGNYRYSKRSSFTPSSEFSDSRGGLFLLFKTR